MTLTSEQQLEMFADIKVIKNNCLNYKKAQEDHEKRISMLEKGYWIFVGISSVITFILPFILDLIIKD